MPRFGQHWYNMIKPFDTNYRVFVKRLYQSAMVSDWVRNNYLVFTVSLRESTTLFNQSRDRDDWLDEGNEGAGDQVWEPLPQMKTLTSP